MRVIRFMLAGIVLSTVAGLAYVAQQIEAAGAAQVVAAQDFLSSLSAEQKQTATFPYDSKERTNWNFIPLQNKERKSTRKGLPLEAMSAEQKRKALALLKAGTSGRGAETAELIMSLEAILRDTEKKGAMVRNPEWYFVTIFGTPSKTGNWGWRFEGHHLSINVTLDGTQIVASTPFFFGANPATLKKGPKEGQKVLPAAQELAMKLIAALDAQQKSMAERSEHFPEPGQNEPDPKVGAPAGLPVAKMNAGQKETLMKLLEAYAGRMPKDVAAAELKAAEEAGLDKIHFAYSGSPDPSKPLTYRVHGPTFVVEYLNIQPDGYGNPNNHIHSSWRRIESDFGLN